MLTNTRKKRLLFLGLALILGAGLLAKWQLSQDGLPLFMDFSTPYQYEAGTPNNYQSSTTDNVQNASSTIYVGRESVSQGKTDPVRLIIPTLGINAYVQQVGLSAKGSLGIPSNFRDVAWYKLGPVPGEPGSAIIDGHLNNGLGLPGVFLHLDNLQVGDKIQVKNKEGQLLTFQVMAKKIYPYDQPVEEIFSPSNIPRLNLITCGGQWIKTKRTYDQRVVVFSQLISQS